MDKWTWKQRLPIGLVMIMLGILPMFFWTGLDHPALLRGLGSFCLLFGLIGGILFIVSGVSLLGVAAAYSLSFVLILLPRAPEIEGIAGVLCLFGGLALLFCVSRYLQKRNKGEQGYKKCSAKPRKKYTSAKGRKMRALSPKAAAIRERMGYLQCGVLASGVLCFILSILKLWQPAFFLALLTIILAAVWGVMYLMILPELEKLPSKKRYRAYPLRIDPTVQLLFGLMLTSLVLLNAAGEILYSWEMLLIPGIFALAAGIFAFLRSRKTNKQRMGAAVLAVLFGLYVGGMGLIAANYVLPAQHTDYEARITNKYKTGGKSTSYRLKCDTPVGEVRLNVSRDRYNRQEIGDQISIREYHGALFMDWRSMIVKTEE